RALGIMRASSFVCIKVPGFTIMKAIVLILAAALAAIAVHAQALTLGTKRELNTLDPHFFASFPTNSSLEYFFDKLVEYGDKLEIRPALATSWRLVDATTWEFKLRKGVVFHDGSPFTADDVIFSFNRARQPTSDMKSLLSSVDVMTKVDDQTLRIKT